VLGFLGSETLRQRAEDGSTGNYGIQDQRLAFAWVQQYITAFGGDNANVMIFGESAGAGSVSNHLTMPRSWPYFQKAGLESGAFADWDSRSFAAAQSEFDQLLMHTSCSSLACLEALPAATFVNVSSPFGPVVDGVELMDYPYKLLTGGQPIHKVPVLLGFNRDEGVSFAGPTPGGRNMTQSNLRDYLQTRYQFDNTTLMQAMQLYNSSIHAPTACCSSWFWAAIAAVGNEHMQCGTRLGALHLASLGVPVYIYSFDHVPFPSATNEFAYHSAEIPYVFHVDDLLDGHEGHKVANIMSQMWMNFATSSDPNKGVFNVSTTWPTFSSKQDTTLMISQKPSVAIHHQQTECNFWKDRFVFP
jgi:carboxylesterase type B